MYGSSRGGHTADHGQCELHAPASGTLQVTPSPDAAVDKGDLLRRPVNPARAVSGPDQPFVKSNVVISNRPPQGTPIERSNRVRTRLALSALALGALLATASPTNGSLTFNAKTLTPCSPTGSSSIH
jgi:hypothetical protein